MTVNVEWLPGQVEEVVKERQVQHKTEIVTKTVLFQCTHTERMSTLCRIPEKYLHCMHSHYPQQH